ncbi:hypothetical protein AMS68_004758 [Peltaster fructicola]|uniref:UBX domain-containing protein n=1 Tax=Peltaster fructicola TaxID=286661 RepID=A0A6H0XX55_9PEZI|nr:hypothetical protein AMS68_004758 [Peltaster fructicola]
MFHNGDLQSGISTAIQQQKLVTCFVHNDGDEASAHWENDLLPSMRQLIAEKTVLLRMKLKSQEASFLSAFCPMEVAPSLAVIDNGRVVIKLQAPVDDDSWRTKLETALRSRDTVIAASPAVQPRESHPSAQPAAVAAATAPRHSQPLAQTPATGQTPSTLHSLMPDRAARLEADQAAKQAEEKAARVARAEAKRREIEAATAAAAGDNGKQPVADALPAKARADWIRTQAKRKEEVKQERERILRQIQSDKEERKLRAAIEKETLVPAEPLHMPMQSHHTASTCALQVRLLDGSSIRRQFAADQTLHDDVRLWIKESGPSDAVEASYTFRHLLAPHPSRDIGLADEQESLGSLDLTPSATLVLLPNDSATSSTPSNLISRLIAMLLGMFASIFAVFAGRHNGAVESSDTTHDAAQQSRVKASGVDTGSSSARLRTKTLADSRAEKKSSDAPAEFYNGNSSAFEGRNDDNGD